MKRANTITMRYDIKGILEQLEFRGNTSDTQQARSRYYELVRKLFKAGRLSQSVGDELCALTDDLGISAAQLATDLAVQKFHELASGDELEDLERQHYQLLDKPEPTIGWDEVVELCK